MSQPEFLNVLNEEDFENLQTNSWLLQGTVEIGVYHISNTISTQSSISIQLEIFICSS